MAIKVYEYAGCSTCKKALKWLDSKKIGYDKFPIVEKPPTKTEIRKMLEYVKKDGGTFKNLFNTSGQLYREFKVGDQIKNGMTEAEALELLSANGKLIKRPFVLGSDFGLIGFKEETWKKAF